MRGTTFYRGREASLRIVGLWETLEEVRMKDGWSHAAIWREKHVWRKEQWSPEVGTRLCLRKIRTASVAGEERGEERMSGNEDIEPICGLCSPWWEFACFFNICNRNPLKGWAQWRDWVSVTLAFGGHALKQTIEKIGRAVKVLPSSLRERWGLRCSVSNGKTGEWLHLGSILRIQGIYCLAGDMNKTTDQSNNTDGVLLRTAL